MEVTSVHDVSFFLLWDRMRCFPGTEPKAMAGIADACMSVGPSELTFTFDTSHSVNRLIAFSLARPLLKQAW
jgi:hypothetical protein